MREQNNQTMRWRRGRVLLRVVFDFWDVWTQGAASWRVEKQSSHARCGVERSVLRLRPQAKVYARSTYAKQGTARQTPLESLPVSYARPVSTLDLTGAQSTRGHQKDGADQGPECSEMPE